MSAAPAAMASQPTSNPAPARGTSASMALAPQLSAQSVTAADQPAVTAVSSSTGEASLTARQVLADSADKGASTTAPSSDGSSNQEAENGSQSQKVAPQRRPSGLTSTKPESNGVAQTLGSGHTNGDASTSDAAISTTASSGGATMTRAESRDIQDVRQSMRDSALSDSEHPARPTSISSAEVTARMRRASSRTSSRRGSAAATDKAQVDAAAGGSVERRLSHNEKRVSKTGSASSPLGQTRSEAIPLATHANPEAVEEGGGPSSSSSSFLGGSAHSQAISARSSPSTVAPMRRPSSGLNQAIINASNQEAHLNSSALPTPRDETMDELGYAALKIRDYAFPEGDPRYAGGREPGVGSPVASSSPSTKFGFGGFGGGGVGGPANEWGIGGVNYVHDDEDDVDDVYGDTSGSDDNYSEGLPLGLYHAVYDFAAESEHELDVKVGQRVRLVGHVDGGWAIVVRVPAGEDDVDADDESSDKGLVPEAYLQWIGS